MGNYFSHDQSNNLKCTLCNGAFENNNFNSYIDMKFPDCDERLKGYFHHECLDKVIQSNMCKIEKCNTDSIGSNYDASMIV